MFVHLLPRLIPPGSLRGGVAVVVDVLRATTVMVHALAAGCEAVIPCGEIDEAKAVAAGLPPGTALLAGERQGLPIPGFDLGNSPGEFTPEVCRRQDARDDHDQWHPRDSGEPGGRARVHRQLYQPAGDVGGDLGPVPQERSRPLGAHRLRGNRGPHQSRRQLARRRLASQIANVVDLSHQSRGRGPLRQRRSAHGSVPVARSGTVSRDSVRFGSC